MQNIPVDAIPDIGEKQVIVVAEWPGRSPQDVDDQVTYPLTVALQGTPGVKVIRSMSGFGFSMVFVIVHDNIDYYWARSRVLERMNVARGRLPAGVEPVLGPDATALGQIFWYTVEGEGFDLAELRSLQDWYVRYQLNAVEGVSEVASIGGHVKQYQIDVDPVKMRAHGVTLPEVTEAVKRSNIDVGAKVIEINRVEFFIRGIGFIKSPQDLENVVIRANEGTPLYVKNVATVSLGPEFRRGTLDKAGVEAVGGVVVMRYGENPLAVIERVKEKIDEIAPGLPTKTLPDGSVSKVKIVSFYDRTTIIHETMDTLKEALIEELIVGVLIVVVFLLHLRSSLAIVSTLPLSVAISFLVMYLLGVDSNIMSLAGLAIAIGDVADMALIMTENIYRRLVRERRLQEPLPVRRGRGVRGRQGHPHGRLQHDRLVHSRLRPDRPGGQALRPAGLHEDLRHHRVGDPGDHGGPDARLSSAQAHPVESAQEPCRRLAGRGAMMAGVSWWVFQTFFLDSEAHGRARLVDCRGDRRDDAAGGLPDGPGAAPAGGGERRVARHPGRLRAGPALGPGPQGDVPEPALAAHAAGTDDLVRLGHADRAASKPGWRELGVENVNQWKPWSWMRHTFPGLGREFMPPWTKVRSSTCRRWCRPAR